MPEGHPQSGADTDEEVANAQMVRQMDQRRQQRSGGPPPTSPPVAIERTCEFCHQTGDHRTAADCARALER
jgi:hypothetical protein